MHSHIFLASNILLIFISIPQLFCQENEQYATCQDSFRCANIENIRYPFWGGNQPDHCGDRAFQLNCSQEDGALITIGPVSYRVLRLDGQTRSLTLARVDLSTDRCPRFLYNSTFNSTGLFSISPTNQPLLALYYGCTAFPGQGPIQGPIPSQFNCTVNSTVSTISYARLSAVSDLDLGIFSMVTCNNSITVPVNETWGPILANLTLITDNLLERVVTSGFGVEWTVNETSCNLCLGSGGRCGSNTDSNAFTCYCANGVFEERCNTTPNDGRGSNTELQIGLGFLAIGLAVIMVILMTIFYYRRKKFMVKKQGQMYDKTIEAFLKNHGSLAPKRFTYADIKKMTNSFADKLGEGGYGSVFKGKLLNGHLVAVKLLTDSNGDGGDFVSEVASISRTSHVNIVTLLGFCLERNKRALVYEFMPNKSLDKFIHKNASSSLNWETLFQIAVGTARGLEYLHRGCNTRIVHFDIKPENILLDEDFCPKISDFGLAKLCQRNKSILSMMDARGTPGYIAPEVFSRNFGEVSHKSDVYSYGMMIINMLQMEETTEVQLGTTSTSTMYFPDFIYKHLELGVGLRGLREVIDENGEETLRKMVLVGLWCIQTNPLDRPSIGKVVEMLEGSIELIRVPPKPVLFSPEIAKQDTWSELSSSYEIQLTECNRLNHENAIITSLIIEDVIPSLFRKQAES